MRKFVLIFATAFGLGYLPVSGTFGSVVGVAGAWLLKDLPLSPYCLTLIAFSFFAIWISHAAELFLAKTDPGCIVIDEVAGMMVSLAFLTFNRWTVLAGFILFRLFDIWKPFPANWAQAKLPGGWGVVMDDLFAGLYANIILQIMIRVI